MIEARVGFSCQANTYFFLRNEQHPVITPPTSHRTNGLPSTLTLRGADVSSLQRALDLGAQYYNAHGIPQHPLDILKEIGVNYIRLRLWNNPPSGYNDKAKVLLFAQGIKAKGFGFMLDFHYSDTWADPAKQYKPARWANHGIAQLQKDVYDYTYDVCSALQAQGTAPDIVQIGNEITNGMLWPEGKVIENDFTNLSLLLKAGYQAVKTCNSAIKVAIHIDRGGDNDGARWFFDGIRNQGVEWDITALSYYCYWHGPLMAMQKNVKDMIIRYDRPVIIAETAYPFTSANADHEPNVIDSPEPCAGYPATPEGQARNFLDVQETARQGGAIGVFYWEPTWIATPGNGWDPERLLETGSQWDNQAIFDRQGRLNPLIKWIRE